MRIAYHGHAAEGTHPAEEATDRRSQPGIVIKPWDPETPYMTELKAAGKEEAFAVYLKNRAEYGTSPAFFLDCADFFSEQGDPQLALQVLSNIAELELENPALLRVLAHRLAQTGNLDLAVLTFEEVLRLRPEEPQSYRDLAPVLVRRTEETIARTKARHLKLGVVHRMDASVRDDYARQATRLLGAVTVQVDVFTNFGRQDQQRQSITVRLKEPDEAVPIGQIEF